MHKFLVCAYKSQDFAQTQENFARSHDCETGTFKNSAAKLHNLKALFDPRKWSFFFTYNIRECVKKVQAYIAKEESQALTNYKQ